VRALPTLSIGDVTIREGHSGWKAMRFTVTLSEAFTRRVTVKYATANGSAKAGTDYQAISGSLTFRPGETTKTITVWVRGDRRAEKRESFLVRLSEPTRALLARGEALGTIVDDD
jgi:hypothetical protein